MVCTVIMLSHLTGTQTSTIVSHLPIYTHAHTDDSSCQAKCLLDHPEHHGNESVSCQNTPLLVLAQPLYQLSHRDGWTVCVTENTDVSC